MADWTGKVRYTALDSLRGFIIWNMIVFHGLYDINVIGGLNPNWPWEWPVAMWQEVGLCIFVMLAGMSFSLMKEERRFFHGLKLNVMGFGITIITFLLLPEEVIFFGVLSFMGCAVWLTMLIENKGHQLLTRMPADLGLIICILLYSFTMHINQGYLGLGNYRLIELPKSWFGNWTAVLGLAGPDFTSADYVPLLPYIFIYWGGSFALRLIKEHCPQALQSMDWPVLVWPGKHSLIIYFLHQPVLLFVLGLI